MGLISDSKLRIRVEQTGSVIWSPTNIFTTNCVTDVTYYPFDTQMCDIMMTSWGYTKNEMKFQVDNKVPLGMNNYKENGEWEYTGYSVRNGVEEREAEQFFQIIYSLTFKRRAAYHVYNTIIPMVTIAFLACLVSNFRLMLGRRLDTL